MKQLWVKYLVNNYSLQQNDVFGSCELRYEWHKEVLVTTRDLSRCSHFTSEQIFGAQTIPLMHMVNQILFKNKFTKLF